MLSQTWRSSFYMLAAVNVLCLIGGLLSIDEDAPHPKDDKKVDWIGASLITIALVMILFVLGDGESAPKQWATGCKCHAVFVCYSVKLIMGSLTDIIALLVVGVFLVGVFIYWQWFLEKAQEERQRRREAGDAGEVAGQQISKRWSESLPPPTMKLSLWGRAKGRFAVTVGIAFLAWASFISWSFWMQVGDNLLLCPGLFRANFFSKLYYQDYVGLTPLQVVARQSPTFVVGVACSAFVGIMASYMTMLKISGKQHFHPTFLSVTPR